MEKKQQLAPHLERAYGTFLSELSCHLEAIKAVCAPEIPDAGEERESLRARFHKIRGGAGFFGLDDLRRIAGELESCLKEGNVQLVVNPRMGAELLTSLEETICALKGFEEL